MQLCMCGSHFMGSLSQMMQADHGGFPASAPQQGTNVGYSHTMGKNEEIDAEKINPSMN